MNLKWQLLLDLLIYYVIFVALVYFLSDYVIFPVPKPSYQDDQTIIKLTTQDHKKISALYLKNPKAHFTLLMSHGNAEDLGVLTSYFDTFKQHGFSIFAYDYHGYGTSEGTPSEKNTYLDIEAAYQYLTESLKVPSNRIILFGRSLGSGPSLELALHHPVAGVILESAMITAFRVITYIPLIPIDKYSNIKKITRITAPILIIHGEKDSIIPFWHGKKLYEVANEPKMFYGVLKANHNDVIEEANLKYWTVISEFTQGILDEKWNKE